MDYHDYEVGRTEIERFEMKLLRIIYYVWNHQLNRDGRLLAIGRLLRWQLASRLLPGPIALQFVEDTTLFASRGETGATGNW